MIALVNSPIKGKSPAQVISLRYLTRGSRGINRICQSALLQSLSNRNQVEAQKVSYLHILFADPNREKYFQPQV